MPRTPYKCRCVNCGNEFTAYRPDATICNRKDCKASKQPIKNGRKCHDCGKLTTNYRCAECWKKYREKNGIALEPEDLDYSFYESYP